MSDPDASSQRDAQPTPTDDRDQLEEAIARANYDTRFAVGEIDGDEVMVAACVNEHDNPVLRTYAGGELRWERDEDAPEYEPKYVGDDSVVRRDCESVGDLNLAFDALVETHDLYTNKPDWDESGGRA